MAEVFLCKTGQLSAGSRRELKRAGVVVVEAEDPAQCKFIRSSSVVSGDDMLWAAVESLKQSYKGDGYTSTKASEMHRERFAFNIIGLIEAARSADKPPEVTDA